MRQHGVVAALEHHHQVVVDQALAVLGEPVAQHVDRLPLRQVVLGVDHVTGPHLGDPELPRGQVVVHRDRHLGLGRVAQVRETLLDDVEVLGLVGVDVGQAGAQRDHRHRGVPVVDDRGLAVVRRVPEAVVRVRQCRDVVGDQVGAPADAGRVDAVGDRVARLPVVPGALERRPHVAEVAEVAVVERPDQLRGDQPGDLVVAREVDVERHRSGADLGDRLVGVVEGRDLDVDAVLLLERLHHRGAEVVGVVVDEQRALLRREAVGDRLVVVGDVPGDGVVGRGDLELGGRPGAAAAGAGRGVRAGLQERTQRRGRRCPSRAALRSRVRRSRAGRGCGPRSRSMRPPAEQGVVGHVHRHIN